MRMLATLGSLNMTNFHFWHIPIDAISHRNLSFYGCSFYFRRYSFLQFRNTFHCEQIGYNSVCFFRYLLYQCVFVCVCVSFWLFRNGNNALHWRWFCLFRLNYNLHVDRKTEKPIVAIQNGTKCTIYQINLTKKREFVERIKHNTKIKRNLFRNLEMFHRLWSSVCVSLLFHQKEFLILFLTLLIH